MADQLIARRRARREGEGRGGEVARDWANECATYWGGSLVGENGQGRGESARNPAAK